MIHTKGIAYVIRRADGKFLKGSSAWQKVWVDEIGSARFYNKPHYAANSMKHMPRYSQTNMESAEVVEVEVTIK